MSYEWKLIIGWEAHLQGQWQPRKSHKETIKVIGGQRLGHVKDVIKDPLSPGENLHPEHWYHQQCMKVPECSLSWWEGRIAQHPLHLWERHLGRFLHNRTFCPPSYPDAPCKALSYTRDTPLPTVAGLGSDQVPRSCASSKHGNILFSTKKKLITNHEKKKRKFKCMAQREIRK